ncbi:MAG: hypothetical protein PHX68_03165 [Alphaproteobacteria bacterium]|nr:hypothetical protein [Alphaproteobacteria bacterium]
MRKILICIVLLGLAGCVSYAEYIRTLTGLTTKQVRSKMGKPLLIRHEEPNQVWVYHRKNCATLVYFNDEEVSTHVDVAGDCGVAPAAEESGD